MRSATETCFYCGKEAPSYGMARVIVKTADGTTHYRRSACVEHAEPLSEALCSYLRIAHYELGEPTAGVQYP